MKCNIFVNCERPTGGTTGYINIQHQLHHTVSRILHREEDIEEEQYRQTDRQTDKESERERGVTLMLGVPGKSLFS
jgi:hypothetical protein